MLGYVPDQCQEGSGGGRMWTTIFTVMSKEGEGMRGAENASTAVSPDDQGMRQSDNGRDREDYEERNGYARKMV